MTAPMRSRGRQHDDEDAAAVIAVMAALAAGRSGMTPPAGSGSGSCWGDPAFRFGASPQGLVAAPGPDAWWASGLVR